jgi:glycosyltransferase involved in cell wall biosynthesis
MKCAAAVDRLWLLSVGNNPPKLTGDWQGLHLQYVGNDRFLSLVYSAADVFVIPSLQDNLPNTVMEAMACGTPVVGFDVGGIRDMVRAGRTGVLTGPGDVDALQTALTKILTSPQMRRGMSEEARRVALSEYPLLLQAERYGMLYKELVS